MQLQTQQTQNGTLWLMALPTLLLSIKLQHLLQRVTSLIFHRRSNLVFLWFSTNRAWWSCLWWWTMTAQLKLSQWLATQWCFNSALKLTSRYLVTYLLIWGTTINTVSSFLSYSSSVMVFSLKPKLINSSVSLPTPKLMIGFGSALSSWLVL